jgi:hypothetical protein
VIDSRTFSALRRRLRASAFALLVLLRQAAFAQEQPPPQTRPDGGISNSQQQGGSATLGDFAPVLDSEKRPITAGGFVKEGPIVFKDVSKEAGLTPKIFAAWLWVRPLWAMWSLSASMREERSFMFSARAGVSSIASQTLVKRLIMANGPLQSS